MSSALLMNPSTPVRISDAVVRNPALKSSQDDSR